MDEAEVYDYLKALEKKYAEKKLEDFWVFTDRATFKPIKESQEKVHKYLKKNAARLAGEHIAVISVYIKPSKTYIKKNKSLVSLMITVFGIKENGTLSSIDRNGLRVYYKKKDLELRKFKLADVDRFMRLCADGILESETMIGISLRTALKKLKNKNIDFDSY
jgi:hypothetical protein